MINDYTLGEIVSAQRNKDVYKVGIKENYLEIKRRKDEAAFRVGRNPDDITLLAVTKLHEPAELQQALDAGAEAFGENKVQELLSKYDIVKPKEWHLIGHLQTNKVRQIIDKVTLIHSVDSIKLAKEIDKRSAIIGRVMDILIEVNIGGEESKYGIDRSELNLLVNEITSICKNIRVRGIMCIPPHSENPEDSRAYFQEAKLLFEGLKTMDLPPGYAKIDTLSMGMSADFEIAIEEGSTIVRVGSSIFGKRNYR